MTKTKKKKRGASAERRDSLDIIDTAVPRKVEEVKKKPKNKKKWKETHECCLDPELDEVQTMYSGRTFEAKFKRWFVRLTLVSPSNPLTKIILQSEAAIRQERFRQLASYPYVVHPFSRTRSIWEVIMVFVFYISIMEVPMNTSFNLSIYEYFRMFDFMLDCICLVDCMFTFFCGYYDKFTHEVHLKPSTVAKHYVCGYFISDFLGAFPFETVLNLFEKNEFKVYLNLIPLLKLLRIFSLITYFKQLCLEVDMAEVLVIALKFTILATIYIQWISCGHYLTAELVQWRYVRRADKDSWIIKLQLVNSSNWQRYFHSLFRGVTIAFNTATGSVPPRTLEDIYYTCFALITGQVFLILLLSLIFQLKSASNASRRKYKAMELQLKEFMRHNRLPDVLQRRMLQYYSFRFRKRYFRETEILETLTGQLSEEIVLYSCRRLVENVEFFKDLPMDLIVRIVTRLKSEIFLPNDVIVEAGSSGDFMYFIASGTVAVYASEHEELAHLEEGSHFGEIALVMEEKRVATVLAVDMCELYRLDRVDFRNALTPYPDLLASIERTAYKRFQDTQEHKRMSSRITNSSMTYRSNGGTSSSSQNLLSSQKSLA